MFKGFLSQPGSVAGTSVTSNDGSIIFMYATEEGRVFKKSFDSGRTFSEEWKVPLGTYTATCNLLRMKDGRLMMPLKNESPDETIHKMGGADFTVVFSSDEGRTWGDENQVNKDHGCYYLMNTRLLRLKSGRILMPLCKHPDDIISMDHFENAGLSGCYYSDDEGQNWTEGKWLSGENAGGMLAEPMVIESDEKVIMYMRTNAGFLYYSESLDEGISFSQAKASELRSPVAPFTVAKDDFSGKFFAVWDNAFPAIIHQGPRRPMCMAVSDDGIKWNFMMEIGNNPDHNYGYPSLHFKEDEIILTYYYNETRVFNRELNQLKINIYNRKELTVREYTDKALF